MDWTLTEDELFRCARNHSDNTAFDSAQLPDCL
jgi:hypothetical protein